MQTITFRIGLTLNRDIMCEISVHASPTCPAPTIISFSSYSASASGGTMHLLPHQHTNNFLHSHDYITVKPLICMRFTYIPDKINFRAETHVVDSHVKSFDKFSVLETMTIYSTSDCQFRLPHSLALGPSPQCLQQSVCPDFSSRDLLLS